MTFAHLTLATVDVQTSSLFFQNTLGWTPVSQPDNINRHADWLNITENQQLHLLLVEEFEPSPLVDHGATLIDPLRNTPFERFFFQDPNGYVFEVIDQDSYQQE